jgi:hypothetical protein
VAARNLSFLLKAGLVDDDSGRIASLVSRPKEIAIQNVQGNELIEVSTENFDEEVLKSSVPTIVIFTAPWAGPGRRAEQALLNEAAKVNYVKSARSTWTQIPTSHESSNSASFQFSRCLPMARR